MMLCPFLRDLVWSRSIFAGLDIVCGCSFMFYGAICVCEDVVSVGA